MFSSTAKILIALWILNPYLDSFSTSEYYVLQQVFTEFVWGTFLLAVGAAQLYASWFGANRLRIITGYISLLIFLYLATVIGIANIASTGVPLFASMAIGEFINVTVFNREDYREIK